MSSQAAQQRRGAADRGEYRQAAGAFAARSEEFFRRALNGQMSGGGLPETGKINSGGM
jgi:hypothetical protein